jgi:hypothetical protein
MGKRSTSTDKLRFMVVTLQSYCYAAC